MQATSRDVTRALKDGAPGSSRRFRLRGVLLGLQVATVVVLLTAAGLLFRAVSAAGSRDFGYEVDALSFASIESPPRGYDAARIAALSSALLGTLDDTGAGHSIALTSTPPLGSGNIKGAYRLPDTGEEFFNSVYEVSPTYFDVLGVSLVAGRGLRATDIGRPVIVVSESVARRHWTVASAVGRRVLSRAPEGGWNMAGELEIVGVARDTYMTGVSGVDATIYQSLSGRTLPYAVFRTSDHVAATALSTIAGHLDPRLRVGVHRLSENVDERLRGSMTAALLASVLGAIAIVLATVGLFGVFAFSVQQRAHEIAIHMALGARSADVIQLMLAANGVPLIAGLAVGAAACPAAIGLLRIYLMGLGPADPLTYAVVALVLGIAGGIATFLPVRRATRIDPLLALRHE